jgi:hypothetical protein
MPNPARNLHLVAPAPRARKDTNTQGNDNERHERHDTNDPNSRKNVASPDLGIAFRAIAPAADDCAVDLLAQKCRSIDPNASDPAEAPEFRDRARRELARLAVSA